MSASVRPVVRHADSPGVPRQRLLLSRGRHDKDIFSSLARRTAVFSPPQIIWSPFEKLDAASPRLFLDALESLLLGDCPTIRRSRRQRRASSCRFGLSRPCGIFPYRLKQGTAPERRDTEQNEKRKDQRKRTPEKTERGKERGGDSAKEGKRRRRREMREGEREKERKKEKERRRERRKERPSTEFRLQKAMLLAGWRYLHGRTVGTKADNLCCVVESIRNR
ncbi:hypothetical protein TGGT1_290645 [Toxoplasma gondii GT1]|uniref:Uncharacterized protein n=2 Tax=Toxoplasma gondii TaxID=5811 RepID=S7W4E6_TOXGG|nr:hypothetical protein TGGT1_290645 [Toxoplasma gondii GT1]RQX73666.1 hypothetical protein TGCAST_387540 [Toxoplasma gondii CAST]